MRKEELRSGGKNLNHREKKEEEEMMEVEERQDGVRNKTEGKVEGEGS